MRRAMILTCVVAAIGAGPASKPASDAYPALQKRLHDLESENARLKARVAELESEAASAPAAAPVAHVTDNAAPVASSGEWTIQPARQQVGDITIELTAAQSSQTPFTDMMKHPQKTAEPLFNVCLKIVNTSTTKRVFYSTWRGKMIDVGTNFASLIDDNANPYKRIELPLGSKIVGAAGESESLNPGASVVDVLVFEAPIAGAKWLTLTLPGANLGQADGGAKFTLTRK